jgi:hypothetical protein
MTFPFPEFVKLIIVAVIAFGLHIYGKFKERKLPLDFKNWVRTADTVHYILYSVALGALGTIMEDEIREPLGFSKPLSYVFAVWYGGSHLVSRILGMDKASKARKDAA